MFYYHLPHRCPDCNAFYYAETGKHECDVDERFLHELAKEQRETLRVETEKAELELRTDNVAATIRRWAENATAPPCPKEDAANVSLSGWRGFAEFLRGRGG